MRGWYSAALGMVALAGWCQPGAAQTATTTPGGTWKGQVEQRGHSGSYAVVLAIGAEGATTSYPDQPCSGMLTKAGNVANYQFYKETIIKGRFDPAAGKGCIDGTITVKTVGDKLYFNWFGADEDGAYTALGTLARDGEAPAVAAKAGPAPAANVVKTTATAVLSAAEIKAMFADGSPFTSVDLTGKQTTLTFLPDGNAISSPQDSNGAPTAGVWKLSQTGYCIKWKNAQEHCYALRKTPIGFDVLDTSKKVVAHMVQ